MKLKTKATACFSVVFKVFFFYYRGLFPQKEDLADELLSNVGIAPTMRPHQLTMEHFNLISIEFERLCEKHDLSNRPLDVRKPLRMP